MKLVESINLNNIRGDITGGITAAIVALPFALAMGLASGASMRTMANVKAGGFTPISGSLHAILLLIIVLVGGKFLSHIPLAVLGAILVKVGTDIIDWNFLKKISKIPKVSVVMMTTVLIITVFYNLMVAVAVGLVMASFVLLQRITELQLEGIVAIQSIEDASHLDESHQELIRKGQTLFYQLNGLMSFGSAKGLVKDFSVRSNYSNAILDLSNVPNIDYTTSRGIAEICKICEERSIEIKVIGTNDKVHKFLENIGVDNSIIE